MGMGAAIAGASAVGSIGSALISSGSAKSAADTQAAAAQQASANQMAQYQETEKNLAPFTGAGQSALQTLKSTLGLAGGNGQNLLAQNGMGGGLTYTTPSQFYSVLGNSVFAPTQAQLAATPGYQFDLAQGQQGVANSNAAQGRGISGAALKGAANYATGLANNTLQTQEGIFQNNYNNTLQANNQMQSQFQQNLGNVLNPLSNLVGVGQNAAATTGSQGIQAVGQSNQALIGGSNAQAAGQVGSANALSSGLNSLSSTPFNYSLYSQLTSGGGSLNPSVNGAITVEPQDF